MARHRPCHAWCVPVARALSLLVLLPVLLGATASAAESLDDEACSLYSTCADCACSRVDYSADSLCVPGCAWIAAQGLCVAATGPPNASTAAVITTLFPLGPAESTSQRVRYVDNDVVACPMSTGNGHCRAGRSHHGKVDPTSPSNISPLLARSQLLPRLPSYAPHLPLEDWLCWALRTCGCVARAKPRLSR